MKHLPSSIFFSILVTVISAQPQKINYQGMAVMAKEALS
jgi:hypothetical protein